MTKAESAPVGVRRWYGLRKLYNFLRKRLGLRRSTVERLGHALGELQAPGAESRRRALARRFCDTRAAAIAIDERAGCALFGPETFAGLPELVEACRRHYPDDPAVGSPVPTRAKDFFCMAASAEDLLRDAAVRGLILSDAVLAIVEGYLHTIPVLGRLDLLFTRPNDSVSESQMFHFDFEDARQLKLVVNILDTSEAEGPFTLVPADASQSIAALAGYSRGRLEDEVVLRHCRSDRLVRVVGAPGSGAFVDTGRCLHFGSRASRPRLVLIAQYLSALAPGLQRPEWQAAADELAAQLSLEQRMLLRLA